MNKFDNYIRALKPALDLLNSINNNLDLPKRVSINALMIYKQCIIKKLTRGRKRESLISACIYISCQENDYPINFKKLCNACNVSRKELIRNKKFIKKFIQTSNQLISKEQYTTKYGYALKLSEEDITKALSIAKKIRLNKSNNSIATISTYLTGKTSIRKLASISGLSKSHIEQLIKLVNIK